MTFAEALAIAYRRKWFAVGGVSAGLAIAALVYANTPPRYEAEALLVITRGSAAADKADVNKNIAQEAGTLARVATTDAVLHAAANKVGPEKLGLGAKPLTRTDLDRLRRSMRTLVDAKSNLVEISYRGSDPVQAADITNAVADSVIERQTSLLGGTDTLRFLEEQKMRLEQEAERTNLELAQFGKAKSMYAVNEQRDLLLRRYSEMSGTLSSTRGSIAKAEGQRRALTDQLLKLKPVTQSPFVTNLVEDLRGADKNKGTPRPIEGDTRTFASNPPILLVRVYQDALVELLKINSELASFESLENSVRVEMERVKKDLETLSEGQSKFEELKRAVAVASAGAEAFGKRMIDEQMAANSAKAQLTEVRVLQAATASAVPVGPRLDFFLMVGFFMGGLFGVACIILAESRPGSAVADTASAPGQNASALRPQPGTRFRLLKSDDPLGAYAALAEAEHARALENVMQDTVRRGNRR